MPAPQLMASPATTVQLFTPQVLHTNTICDACRNPLVGIRYKCINCADFDLCGACEMTDHKHESSHLFVKIVRPLPHNIQKVLVPHSLYSPEILATPAPQPATPTNVTTFPGSVTPQSTFPTFPSPQSVFTANTAPPTQTKFPFESQSPFQSPFTQTQAPEKSNPFTPQQSSPFAQQPSAITPQSPFAPASANSPFSLQPSSPFAPQSSPTFPSSQSSSPFAPQTQSKLNNPFAPSPSSPFAPQSSPLFPPTQSPSPFAPQSSSSATPLSPFAQPFVSQTLSSFPSTPFTPLQTSVFPGAKTSPTTSPFTTQLTPTPFSNPSSSSSLSFSPAPFQGGMQLGRKEVLQVVGELGFQLLGKGMKAPVFRSDPLIISPLAVTASLLIAMNGASQPTYQHIADKLGFASLDLQILNREVGQYMKDLSGLGYKFANGLWATAPDLKVKSNFKKSVEESLGAEIYAPVSKSALDQWVQHKTNSKIRSIMTPEPHHPHSLISAVSFAGGPVICESAVRSFTHEGYVVIQDTELLCYEESNGVQAAWIPYKEAGASKANFGAIVILPATGTSIADFAGALNYTKWTQLLTAMKKRPGQITLPKFCLTGEANLTNSLLLMGAMTSTAQFPNVTDAPFAIGNVSHRVKVDWQDPPEKPQNQRLNLKPAFDMNVYSKAFIFAICDLEGFPLVMSAVGSAKLEHSFI